MLYGAARGLENMAKTAKPPDWRGKDWTDRLPVWHADHPLRGLVGGTFIHEVGVDGDTVISVSVPALGDEDLEKIIAGFAAGDTAENIGKLAPYIGLERVAWWYDHDFGYYDDPGPGTPEKLDTLYKALAIKVHGLVTSRFQPLLKLICGNAADSSGWVSRRASALSYWASLPVSERPNPVPDDGIAGTSDFTKWLIEKTIDGAAAKWRELRETKPDEPGDKPQWVWVVRTGRDEERVFETEKTATEHYSDMLIFGPSELRKEPASNFDLSNAVVDTNDGEYIEFTEDAEISEAPLKRIAGEPLPMPEPDDDGKAEPADKPDTTSPRGGQGLYRPVVKGDDPLRAVLRLTYPKIYTPASDPTANAIRIDARNRFEAQQRPKLEAAIAATAAAHQKPEPSDQTPKHYVTPPDHLAWLNENYGPFDFDAAPANREEGYDALTVAWGNRTYANGPFSARNSPDGVGPAAYARKAIQENKLGKRIVMPLPGRSYENELLAAGAEAVALGQVPYEDAATGEPMASPPYIALYVLWESPEQSPAGLRKRVTELETENAELKAKLAELEAGKGEPDPTESNVVPIKRSL
jgi:hypothetical protein